jgi:hypothetical protein
MLWVRTEACARFALLAAILAAPAVLGTQTAESALLADIAKMSRVAQSFNDAYGNFSDPSAIVYWWFSQLYNAQLGQTFPTNPKLRINPQNINFYQLRSCARADVGRCLLYGACRVTQLTAASWAVRLQSYQHLAFDIFP